VALHQDLLGLEVALGVVLEEHEDLPDLLLALAHLHGRVKPVQGFHQGAVLAIDLVVTDFQRGTPLHVGQLKPPGPH